MAVVEQMSDLVVDTDGTGGKHNHSELLEGKNQIIFTCCSTTTVKLNNGSVLHYSMFYNVKTEERNSHSTAMNSVSSKS